MVDRRRVIKPFNPGDHVFFSGEVWKVVMNFGDGYVDLMPLPGHKVLDPVMVHPTLLIPADRKTDGTYAPKEG